VHDILEVPEPLTLVGVSVHDVLFVVRVTTPAKLLMAVIVMVEVAALPAYARTLIGLALMEKSWTTSVTVTEWDRLPLVPFSPTWNVPDDVNVQDRVELPEPSTLVGERLHDVLLVVRLTPPAKPLTAETAIVEAAAPFTFTLTLLGLALIVKSWTTNVTVTEWDRDPLVPVTATWNVPVEANVHESVELPEPDTIVGESEHEVLFELRPTTAANPLTGLTVIVEVPV
jgi:hypothetical protein